MEEDSGATTLVTSGYKEEQIVRQSVDIDTKVMVMGVDVGESHTDAYEETKELYDYTKVSDLAATQGAEMEAKLEAEKTIDDKDQGNFGKNTSDVDQEKPSLRRNLLPDEPQDQKIDEDSEKFSKPEKKEPEHDEGNTDQEGRRNLLPSGSENGIEDHQSEVSKPSDNTDAMAVKDLNQNPVITEEVLAGKAVVGDNADDDDDDNELPWAMYRNLEKVDRPSDAEDEFSADDESTFDGKLNTVVSNYSLICYLPFSLFALLVSKFQIRKHLC